MIALVDSSMADFMAVFIASEHAHGWLMRRTKGITYTGINIETLAASCCAPPRARARPHHLRSRPPPERGRRPGGDRRGQPPAGGEAQGRRCSVPLLCSRRRTCLVGKRDVLGSQKHPCHGRMGLRPLRLRVMAPGVESPVRMCCYKLRGVT